MRERKSRHRALMLRTKRNCWAAGWITLAAVGDCASTTAVASRHVMAHVTYVRRPRGGAGGRSTRRGGASGSNLVRTSVATARKTHRHTPCGRAAERYMTPSNPLGMKPLTSLLEYRPLFPPRYRVRQAELCKHTVPREVSDVAQADSVAPQLTWQAVQRLDLVLSEPAVPLCPYGRLLGREIDTLDDSSTLPAPVRGCRRSVQRIAVHRRVTQPRTRHGHARHSQIRHLSRLRRTSAPQAQRRSARAPRSRRRRGRRWACDGQERPVDG